jgi:hypothetical protein
MAKTLLVVALAAFCAVTVSASVDHHIHLAKRHASQRASSTSAPDPNKRHFIISQWNDLATCTQSLAWNFTDEAGVCVNLGAHSSDWSCPPIPRNSGLKWIKYASYSLSATAPSTSCDINATVAAMHWNFCGECKANVLRECTPDGNVKLSNCSDSMCKTCGEAVVMKPAACTLNAPLPEVAGQAVQLLEITSDVDSMYHQWYEGSGTCQSSSIPANQHGWDLIALGKCNNGWTFQCV